MTPSQDQNLYGTFFLMQGTLVFVLAMPMWPLKYFSLNLLTQDFILYVIGLLLRGRRVILEDILVHIRII